MAKIFGVLERRFFNLKRIAARAESGAVGRGLWRNDLNHKSILSLNILTALLQYIIIMDEEINVDGRL